MNGAVPHTVHQRHLVALVAAQVLLVVVFGMRPMLGAGIALGLLLAVLLAWGFSIVDILVTTVLAEILLLTGPNIELLSIWKFRIEELAFAGLWLLYLLNMLVLPRRSAPKHPQLTKYTVLFLCAVGLSLIVGLLSGYPVSQIALQLRTVLLLSAVLPLGFFIDGVPRLRTWIWTTIVILILVSVSYTLFGLYAGHGIRFATDQGPLFNVILSVALCMVFFSAHRPTKILGIVVLPFVMIAILLSLYRALWVSAAAVVFSLAATYIVVHQYNQRNLVRGGLYLAMLAAAVWVLSFVVLRKDIMMNLAERFTSLGTASRDLSLLARIELGYYAMTDFIKQPIFGCGLGTTVSYKYLVMWGKRTVHPWMDFSYLNLLWKFGIVGFLLFLRLNYLLAAQSWRIYRQSRDRLAWFGLAIWAGVIGLAVQSLATGFIFEYRFALFWAFLMAMIERWHDSLPPVANAAQ